MLMDLTKKNEIIDANITSRAIQFLLKSKNIKIFKSKSFKKNFLSSNASNILFNLSLNTKLIMINFWLSLKFLRPSATI